MAGLNRLRDAEHRALLLLTLIPFLFLFYFCCFTENSAVTEMGTNIGRLLMPLQSFALPVFLIAWKYRQLQTAWYQEGSMSAAPVVGELIGCTLQADTHGPEGRRR